MPPRGFIEAQVETIMANPRLPKLFVREMLDYDAAHAVEQIQHVAATMAYFFVEPGGRHETPELVAPCCGGRLRERLLGQDRGHGHHRDDRG